MSSTKLANGGMQPLTMNGVGNHSKFNGNSSNDINGNHVTKDLKNGNGFHNNNNHSNNNHNHNHQKLQNGHGKHSTSAHLPDDVSLAKFGNVHNPYTYEIISETAQYLLDRTEIRPKIGIICGSGLGGLADLLEDKQDFPYEEIPHFPVSTVAGHAGKLVFGQMSNVPVICMQGRFHFYEGYPLWKCSMPVRVFKLMGIEILIVTNAAGGLNENYKVGDIMLLKDHLNLPGFGGDSPLRGPNDERFGPRFPALNTSYDAQLRLLAKQVANELGMNDFMREGVYTMVGGPCYETVAELRAMKTLGVDAVGMSTIPEVIMARHCGIRCLSFSLITNACIMEYDSKEEASHEEVQETAAMRQQDLQNFVTRLIPSIQQMHVDNK